MANETITGLALFSVRSPFADRDTCLLDLVGPWNEAMLDAFDDHVREPEIATMWSVWEGSVEVEHDDLLAPDWHGHTFAGRWRIPTAFEIDRITRGRLPLSDEPFPAETIVIPAKVQASVPADGESKDGIASGVPGGGAT